MVKTKLKLKINPKDFRGLELRREFLEELEWRRILRGNKGSGERLPVDEKTVIWASPGGPDDDKEAIAFLKDYFKDTYDFSDEERVGTGTQTRYSPEEGGEIEEDLIKYIELSISLKDSEKFKDEVLTYFSDITEFVISYGAEKQEEIIGNLLLEKYKESGNERMVIIPRDFEWKQFIHINLFGKNNILDSFTGQGLIKNVKLLPPPRLPNVFEYREGMLGKANFEFTENFHFEVELTLTEKGKTVLSSKDLSKYEESKETNKQQEELDKGMMPSIFAEKGIGYFRPDKDQKPIKIGSKESNPYRLLECLFSPSFGSWKPVSIIAEALRERSRDTGEWKDPISGETAKVHSIQNAIKQLQKKLGRKKGIQFKWDDSKYKKNLRIKLM